MFKVASLFGISFLSYWFLRSAFTTPPAEGARNVGSEVLSSRTIEKTNSFLDRDSSFPNATSPKSKTRIGREALAAMGTNDPMVLWKVISDMDTTFHAKWNLKMDLIAEVAERDGLDAALSVFYDTMGPGESRTALVGRAFGYANDTDQHLTVASEKLEFQDERSIASTALWLDQRVAPRELLAIKNLSPEGSWALGSRLGEMYYNSKNPEETLAEVYELWESAEESTRSNVKALEGLIFTMANKDRAAGAAFYERFGKNFISEDDYRDRISKMK